MATVVVKREKKTAKKWVWVEREKERAWAWSDEEEEEIFCK